MGFYLLPGLKNTNIIVKDKEAYKEDKEDQKRKLQEQQTRYVNKFLANEKQMQDL